MSETLRTIASNLVNISDNDWEAMRQILKPKTIKRNDHFLIQGEVCRQMGFITQGYFRLYFLRDDEEITKDFCFENTFCGSYASFTSGAPSRFNVKAMEDAIIFTLDRQKFLDLTDKYPAWQKFIRISVENLFVRKELREASFLLDSAEERYEAIHEENKEMIHRVPLKYIASYLGVSAETLSRIRARNK